MKRQICYLLLILLLSGILPSQTAAAETLEPSSGFYVNDFADVISEDVENEIIEYGSRLEEQTGAQVVLVTIDFTNGDSMENYSMDLFNKWKIGSEEKNNGLLILLSVGDDDYWAMQGSGLEDTLSSGKISSILNEYLEPDFAAKDYSTGAEKVYGAFIQELGGRWKNASE
ncbi:MAG: TPM domain-containing protein, partial [Lacrimispora sphenoides]